jgi:hypothetical protein
MPALPTLRSVKLLNHFWNALPEIRVWSAFSKFTVEVDAFNFQLHSNHMHQRQIEKSFQTGFHEIDRTLGFKVRI